MTRTAELPLIASNVVASVTRFRPTAAGLSGCAGSAVLAATVVLFLAGCDQRSDEARTLHSAAETLNAVGVTPAVGTTKYDAKLKEVATAANSVTSSGTDGEKAAAAVLAAITLGAQGGIAAAEAKNIELDVRNRITGIAGKAGDYSRQAAAAAALQTFDPETDIQALGVARAARDEELNDLRTKLEAEQAKLQGLESQGAAKVAATDVAAGRYAKAMEAASGLSATQGAEAVRLANISRREADNLRTEAGKLQAQIDLLKPVVQELALLADKASNQIKSSERTVADLQARVAAARKDAADLMQAATVASNDADKAIVELVEIRSKELAAAYSKAIDLFTKQVGKASAGSSVNGSGAKVTIGSATMSVAETHWAQAQGARTAALMYESMATVNPALPNRSAYQKYAIDARDEAKKSIELAVAALETAKGNFESSSSKDAGTKARLVLLAEQVGKLKEAAEGAAIAAPTAAQVDEAAGATVETAAAEVEPALRAVVETYVSAMKVGKMASLASTIYTTSDKSKKLVESQLRLTDAILTADAATMQRFNEPMMTVLSAVPGFAQGAAMMGGGADFSKIRNMTVADVKIISTGDNATVVFPGNPAPLTFKKVDGAWVQDASLLDAAAAQIPPAILGLMDKMPALFESWGADVAAGKFADKAAAVAAFQQALMPIQMEMMNTMPGAGGGGGGGGG